MKKEQVFSGKTQSKYLCAAKIICLSFLFSVPVEAFAEGVKEAPAVNIVQQQRTVKGTVVDAQGEPIIGANVKVVGTTTGAITDLDGKFNLSAQSGAKIEVSFIGYTTQVIAVPASGMVKVTLVDDTKLLDEVVVVGYGTQRVKDLTGAASSVPLGDVEQLPGTSVMESLAGRVVGLNISASDGRPGSTPTITIRQPSPTLAGGVTFGPLVVIDDVVQVNDLGEPDMNALNMLDHSEIESMTILKDASAAVYGSRASNGVILVKTKRGSVGAPKISYSGKLDFTDAVSHAKVMNAYETGIFTNRMFRQYAAQKGGDDKYATADYLFSDAELNQLKNMNYNWLDEAWHSAMSQRHSLSVNGGSDKVTFFAGVSYQDQDTNLGNVADYNKWTFRAGGEVKVALGLKLSASVAGYSTKKTSPNYQAKINRGPWGNQSQSTDYVQLHHMPAYIPWEVTTDQGTYFTSPYVGPHHDYVYNNDDAMKADPYMWNFFANEASNARKVNEENGYNANFSLSYEVPFIKGLSLKASYAINYANASNNDIGDYYQLAFANNINKEGQHLIGDYTTFDYPTFGVKDKPLTSPVKIIYESTYRKNQQMNFTINYARKIGDHDFSITGVVERAENEGHAQKTVYYSPDKSYNGVSNTAGSLGTKDDYTFTRNESGALSYIGRANYNYAGRYLAQFIIRADASTKFAPENYWGTFPTGSVGWVISEEKFFKNSKLAKYVDFLKLRYSLGKTGKDNVRAWAWLSAFDVRENHGIAFGVNGGYPINGVMYNGTANRNIKWDSTVKSNYGMDINVLNNRLNLSVDYFFDKTKDKLMTVAAREGEPSVLYIGTALPAMNYGRSEEYGWEFSLSWRDRINQDLLPSWGPIRYGISMNYGISWSKVTRGNDSFFTYPSYMETASEAKNWTGAINPTNVWGFKTWNGTSKGDGILRTQQDIDNYWNYLTQNAANAKDANGNPISKDPSYFDIKSKDEMYLGMLAYQDLGGDNIDTEGRKISGPDGAIRRDEDYAKLASDRRHGISTNLSLQWGDFSWSAQLTTQWGGYRAIYHDVKQGIDNSTVMWSQFSYMNDMFDPTDNPNGRYPTMAVGNAYGEMSDFWMVPTFRMYVRNMTFAYSVPKKWLSKVNIEKLQVSLTGNNLWDFYNPYPDNYRNMYDDGKASYPTLRTWTLGLNLTF